MGTVLSATNQIATAFGNQRKIDRCQNGVLWSLVNQVNTGNSTAALALAFSTDGGATWTAAPAAVSFNATNYGLNSCLYIDVDDIATIAYKDAVDGYIKVVRGTPNAARTAYTWSAATVVENSSTIFDHPDIVVCRDPAAAGAWVGYVVYARVDTGTAPRCYGRLLRIAAGGSVTVAGSADLIGSSIASNNGGLSSYPSVEFNHNGDGKTVAAGTPHWYVTWSNGSTGSGWGIRFRKASYAGGSWTWGTEREIDNTRYIAGPAYWLNCLFDGTRIVLAGYLRAASSNDYIVFDRDAADTTTVSAGRSGSLGTSEFMSAGSATYDNQGNVYLFGTAASGSNGSQSARYRRFTRSTSTFESAVVFDATAPDQPYVSARRGPQGQAIDYVYTDGTASPYSVMSGRIVLNQNPTAPTPVSPADNATWDSATDQTVTLGYSDPDNDAASKARVCYRPKGTTVPYAVLEVSTSAASGSPVAIPVPANTWTGDVQWYGQVADASGTWSDPSATRTVSSIPAALAAATGGAGGTSASALDLYNQAQTERALRALSLV